MLESCRLTLSPFACCMPTVSPAAEDDVNEGVDDDQEEDEKTNAAAVLEEMEEAKEVYLNERDGVLPQDGEDMTQEQWEVLAAQHLYTCKDLNPDPREKSRRLQLFLELRSSDAAYKQHREAARKLVSDSDLTGELTAALEGGDLEQWFRILVRKDQYQSLGCQ